MTSYSAMPMLCVLAFLAMTEQATSGNVIKCPCGNTGTYIEEYLEISHMIDVCSKWANCKKCQDDLEACLECPAGFEGSFCTKKTDEMEKSREKRQAGTATDNCPQLAVPNVGRIRCTTTSEEKSCIGKCFPGYNFEYRQPDAEIKLTCRDGAWTPFDQFPKCKSSGRCALEVEGHGRYNCSIGSEGTKCDVHCSNQYMGTFNCVDEKGWKPQLPTCVRPKEVQSSGAMHQLCPCENGGSCDENGNCICPVGYTGQLCKLASQAPEVLCTDPGQVLNAKRNNMDGSPSIANQLYKVGQSVEYNCFPGFALQLRNIITCLDSGLWSHSLPSCRQIQSPAPKARPATVDAGDIAYCLNPGTLRNGRITYYSNINSPSGSEGTLDEAQYPEGSRLQYNCDNGYLLQGSPSIMCEAPGIWSNSPPTCIATNRQECGHSFVHSTRRVINGTKTRAGEWPWVVAIATRDNGISRVICGGALLNTTTVVTAAHCLGRTSTYTLYFGKFYRRDTPVDEGVMVRQSTRLVIHPHFDSTTYDSDIALIIFEPIHYTERVQPICLPTEESTSRNLMIGGKVGSVTGWGLTERSLQSDELLLANLPVLTNSACTEAYRQQDLELPLTRNMFCAGFENGQQSVCTGDSGSPLCFYDKPLDRYTLEGVVSFAVRGQCGLPKRYTVFTRVFEFVPWILTNIT